MPLMCLFALVLAKSSVYIGNGSFSVTNRTPGYWWFFLAYSYPQQNVLPVLGGSFWPTHIRNKSYARVLVALSGPLLPVTNRSPGSWWLCLAHSYPQ